MLNNHPTDGQGPSFKGSMIIYTGENVDDVRKIIEDDVYATSGVWDLEKVQIIPVSLIQVFSFTTLTPLVGFGLMMGAVCFCGSGCEALSFDFILCRSAE